MRIAILTLPLKTNYGGILQCYALQTVLERMGHKVEVLDKPLYKRSYYIYWGLAILKRLIKKLILHENISILYAPYQVERIIIRKNTDHFIKNYIHKYSKRTWNCSLAKYFDAFVVGSDQVWRPAYAISIEQYFLSFLGNANTKRISYAASFGLDNCDEFKQEQLNFCSDLLKKFDDVSVREDSAVNLCKKYFGIDAVQVLDPTLLLSADDYIKLYNCEETKLTEGNLLVYFLDETIEKKELINLFSSKNNLTSFYLDAPDERPKDQSCDLRPKMSVEQWLRSFAEAEFVITDSFHGCVFSIIFHKQFLVLENQNRGECRLTSLLKLLLLKDRYFNTDKYSAVLDFDMKIQIDFDFIDQILNRQREFAFKYLNSAINK